MEISSSFLLDDCVFGDKGQRLMLSIDNAR